MQKKITESTGAYSLGLPYQSKLFRVPTGTYVGRRVALVKTSTSEIKLFWTDSPMSGWSSPVTIVSDAANRPLDAVMTDDGDIHLIYSEATTVYLVTRKLTLSGGTWSVGTKVTIHDGAQGFDPSLAIEPGGKLWVSFSRFISPSRSIRVKSSTDDGATWCAGASDPGDELLAATMLAWSQCLVDDYSIHVIYNNQDTALSIRSQALTGGGWSSQYNIATGNNFGLDFHAAVGADNRIGVVFRNLELYYREFDGTNWGAVTLLETALVESPQLLFEGSVPAVVYMKHIGADLKIPVYTERRTGTFSNPETLDRRVNNFDAVLLYDASSETYDDLTTEAASSDTADVYHSSSGAVVQDSGDILYLGMDARFRSAHLTLSAVGVGGSVLVSYWDGADWQAFTPANGAADLGSTQNDLVFWTDFSAMPDDWQKRTVNSQMRYWIKIEVASAFSTGPVGSMLSASTNTNRFIVRRG